MAKQSIAAGIAAQVTGLGLGAAAPASPSPASPAATSSATLQMMGLAVPFTPASTAPRVLVIVTGVAATATAAASVTVGGRYGTGTAPANGAAVTGTRFGPSADAVLGPAAAAGAGVPFTVTDVLTLAPGTAYWLDLAVATGNASDAASVTAVKAVAVELP